jgi:hypothetical protein
MSEQADDLTILRYLVESISAGGVKFCAVTFTNPGMSLHAWNLVLSCHVYEYEPLPLPFRGSEPFSIKGEEPEQIVWSAGPIRLFVITGYPFRRTGELAFMHTLLAPE